MSYAAEKSKSDMGHVKRIYMAFQGYATAL